MLSRKEPAQTADLIPLVVADVYHLAGAFRRSGTRIAKRVGQTQARWQLLSVISDGSRPVAQIARRLGLVRQSVQRTANQLVRLRLARYVENPDHRRSPLVRITDQGKRTLALITREAEKSHVNLGADFKRAELVTALRVIRQLCSTLDGRARRKHLTQENK
jgi:DNA-binding MarR family transcriptional regulator